jgi:hypothetical protein
MRGWRRLGIVLSVLWFVGFFYWRAHDYADSLSELRTSMVVLCWHSADDKLESLRVGDPQYYQKSDDINKERNVCESEANGNIERIRREDLPNYRNETFIIEAVSIAFFWLLAWITVRVGRWVIAGFRQEA